MKYLLDSNTCIRYINGRAPNLREKMRTIPVQDIVICSIVKAELFFGAAKSQTPDLSVAKQQRFVRRCPLTMPPHSSTDNLEPI